MWKVCMWRNNVRGGLWYVSVLSRKGLQTQVFPECRQTQHQNFCRQNTDLGFQALGLRVFLKTFSISYRPESDFLLACCLIDTTLILHKGNKVGNYLTCRGLQTEQPTEPKTLHALTLINSNLCTISRRTPERFVTQRLPNCQSTHSAVAVAVLMQV